MGAEEGEASHLSETETDFCECYDPGQCECGKPLPFTGRAAPSGLLLDRWGGCGLCSQAGRMRLSDWLRVAAQNALMYAIVFLIGCWLGSRGWRLW